MEPKPFWSRIWHLLYFRSYLRFSTKRLISRWYLLRRIIWFLVKSKGNSSNQIRLQKYFDPIVFQGLLLLYIYFVDCSNNFCNNTWSLSAFGLHSQLLYPLVRFHLSHNRKILVHSLSKRDYIFNGGVWPKIQQTKIAVTKI